MSGNNFNFESKDNKDDDRSLKDAEDLDNNFDDKQFKVSLDLDDIASIIGEENKLRCNHCKNYLSHFPIYLSAEQHNICGRCYDSLSEKNSYVENQVYEDVAQMIQFPCRYKNEGCLEKLLPTDIPAHEKNCCYRVVKCLTVDFTDCAWEGALPNLLHHCQDKHSDFMLKDGEFKLDLANSHLCSNILQYESTLFVITRQYCSVNKLLELSVCNIECQANKGEFLYEINFTNSNKNFMVNCKTTHFDNKKIEEIFLDSLKDRNNSQNIITARITVEDSRDEPDLGLRDNQNSKAMLAVLKCAFCDEYALPPIYEITTGESVESKIRCSDCRSKQNNDKLTFSAPPCSQTSKNIFALPVGPLHYKDPKRDTDKLTLSGLHSPVTISNNIFSLPLPDSLSNNKDPKRGMRVTARRTNSPCTSTFGSVSENSNVQNSVFNIGSVTSGTSSDAKESTKEIRNYNLDKLANLLSYPCKFEKNGCNFVSRPPQMEQHLTNCLYGSYGCPVRKFKICPWTGLGKDVTAHVEAHKDIMINNSAELTEFVFMLKANNDLNVSRNLQETDLFTFKHIKCFVIKFSNKLFKLCYSEKEDKFYWIVQMIGQFEDKFMYELEIINKDKSNKNENLIIRRKCLSLTDDKELFQQPNTTYFHSDQIYPFVLNNELTFKVKIFK